MRVKTIFPVPPFHRTAATVAAVLSAPLLASSQPSREDAAPFAQSRLAVLADGAMLASGYVDTQLGPRVSGPEDTLTIFSLDAAGQPTQRTVIPVTNSVAGWPNCLDFTPDGRYAFVAETFGPRPESARTIAEVPAGQTLSVVDLQAGRVVQTLAHGPNPSRVAVHPSGAWVAVTRNGSKDAISLHAFREGRLGAPLIQTDANTFIAGGPAPEFRWHPSGRFAAVTLPGTNEVAFFRFDLTDPASPRLQPWGNKVATGLTPGVANWTPDGRHLVITNLFWDEDVEDSWGRDDNQSTIMVYRFDAGDDRSPVPVRRFRDAPSNRGPVHHARVANVAVGSAAENLAVSPDGRWIVTLNMETSFLPTRSPAYAPQSSLSLLEWDAAAERLINHGKVPFEGVLPEGITFDRTGRYLAVANFDHHLTGRAGGSLDLWTLVPGPVPTLVKLNQSFDVPRGSHVVSQVP